MPDDQEQSASFLLTKEILENLRILHGKVDKLNDSLVGIENCKNFRSDFDKRLKKVEKVCISYEAVKPSIVDAATLIEAKQETRDAAKMETDKAADALSARVDKMDEKLDALLVKTQILSLSWDAIKKSPGALALLVAFVAALIGIYYGRSLNVYDAIGIFGWEKVIHFTLVFLMVILLIIIMVWMAISGVLKAKAFLEKGGS
jgi:hypothetical protein